MVKKSEVIPEEEIIIAIERVGHGMSLWESCEISKLRPGTVYQRIRTNEHLAAMYAGARVDYQHMRVDEMHRIAKTEENPQRARLICDNIKWEACKVAPKQYGDKLTQEVTGKDGKDLIPENTALKAMLDHIEKKAVYNYLQAAKKGDDKTK